MAQRYGTIYLRDLTGVIRSEVETIIRRDRPDLAKLMDSEDPPDISIGDLFAQPDFMVLPKNVNL